MTLFHVDLIKRIYSRKAQMSVLNIISYTIHWKLHITMKFSHFKWKENIPCVFLPDIKRCAIFKSLGFNRNDGRYQFSILWGKLLYQFSTEVGFKKWGFRSLKSCKGNFGLYQLCTTHIALQQCWATSCCCQAKQQASVWSTLLPLSRFKQG